MATLKMIILSLFVVKLFNLFLSVNSFETGSLYEVTAFNPHERQILYFMHIKKSSTIFINGVTNEAAIPIDVIVQNDTCPKFEAKLRSDGIQYESISPITE